MPRSLGRLPVTSDPDAESFSHFLEPCILCGGDTPCRSFEHVSTQEKGFGVTHHGTRRGAMV